MIESEMPFLLCAKRTLFFRKSNQGWLWERWTNYSMGITSTVLGEKRPFVFSRRKNIRTDMTQSSMYTRRPKWRNHFEWPVHFVFQSRHLLLQKVSSFSVIDPAPRETFWASTERGEKRKKIRRDVFHPSIQDLFFLCCASYVKTRPASYAIDSGHSYSA